jgi:hypothetical protein
MFLLLSLVTRVRLVRPVPAFTDRGKLSEKGKALSATNHYKPCRELSHVLYATSRNHANRRSKGANRLLKRTRNKILV